MVGEELLTEIDATLDQLIRNAEAIQKADIKGLSDMVVEAFQKTQESLLQHFIHMDQLLDAHKKNLKIVNSRSASCKIREKLYQFEKLKSVYNKTLSEMEIKLPILSKRRSKRFLSIR